MYWLSLTVAFLLATDFTSAEDSAPVPDFPRTAPLEPADAVKSFEVLHGFSMQLIASEPLIADPVDVAYDEDGRGYVVEMRDYPYPEEKGAVPTEFIGQVRLIEDTDDDGVFDRSHVFADKLSWPTSVACWKGGVFVTAAPDIWYFKDTDGDQRADIRERVFTGFSRENVQAIVNGLRWGLDNLIYGAASGNGGRVVADQESTSPVVVTRHDFRFDPQSRRFEAIPGGARFGNSFDDWGNRFVCNIRNPVQHVVLPEHPLLRNPLLSLPNPVHDVAESGDQLPVYRISPPEAWRIFRAQRWTSERVNYPRSELIGAGYWTSSSGATIFRGGSYPPEFQGNAFIGEVAGNLIHRQVLRPDGVTFTSRRADAEREFVASRDTWFRPVNFVNAPDGTLHVLDMYRETIEHPWSIPDDIKAKLDLRRGNDRGRIYRLTPPQFFLSKKPRLGAATTAELVAQMANPDSWWRETAQRLICERQDMSAVGPLRTLLRTSHDYARLHSLYALHGLHALEVEDLLHTLDNDASSHVRRHAILLAESKLLAAPALLDHIIELAELSDDKPEVRLQLALALGTAEPARSVGPLAQIAITDAQDVWIRTAMLAAASRDPLSVLSRLVQMAGPVETEGMTVTVSELARLVAASGSIEKTRQAAELLEQIPATSQALSFALASGLGSGLQYRRQNFSLLMNEHTKGAGRVRGLLEQAAKVAQDQHVSAEQRLAAIELLRFSAEQNVIAALSPLLSAREPANVQSAAIRVIQANSSQAAAQSLIDHWQTCSATSGQQIVDALLSRPTWTESLVGALESEAIRPAQLTIPQRSRLVGHANAKLQERAIKLLGPAATTVRSSVIKDYQPALSLIGDRARGEHVYRRECMTCHRLGSVGHDVGPNLNTVRHRSAQEILVHLFDPNREIAPQFISYSLQLRDGRVTTGIVTNDTAAGIELQRGDNVRETVARQEIEEIVSSGKSLMPEGLEQKVTQQDVADLISFLLAK
jgi:putative membrane-bound dehydrogenase-like protein